MEGLRMAAYIRCHKCGGDASGGRCNRRGHEPSKGCGCSWDKK
jgi:hypothetical protein